MGKAGTAPAGSKPEETPLTKALGPKLADVAEALSKQGYTEISLLGSAKKEVEKAIRKAAPDAKDGDIAKIVQLWELSRKKEEEAPPLDIPDLPKSAKGKTFDLSAPEIEFEEVSYKLPVTLVSKKGGKFRGAHDLTQLEWMGLAAKTGMLFGINVNRLVPAQQDGNFADLLAEKPALLWKVADDFIRPGQPQRTHETSMKYTSSMYSLVKTRMMALNVAASTPFASAAVAAEHAEKHARSQSEKRLYMVGSFLYEYARVNLRACTVPAPGFIAAIDAALAATDPAAELRKVFDTYGHVVPNEVTLGGKLYFTSERTMKGEINEDSESENLKAALNVKYAKVKAKADLQVKNEKVEKSAVQEILEHAASGNIGGDPTLEDPADWSATVQNVKWWDIVSRQGGATPVIDLLDDGTEKGKQRLAKVKQVWNAYLDRVWHHSTRPDGYVFPDMDGDAFTLQPAKPGGAIQSSSIPNQRLGLAPASMSSEPAANRLLWELWYAGKRNADGWFIYYIVEYQDESLKKRRVQEQDRARAKNAAMRMAGLPETEAVPPLRLKLASVETQIPGGPKVWAAVCVDLDSRYQSGQDPTEWTLIPAPAEPRDASNGKFRFALRNERTGYFLGSLQGGDEKFIGLDAALSGQPVWVLQKPPR